MCNRIVFTDLSSNITSQDVKTSLYFIVNPKKWFDLYYGEAIGKFKQQVNNLINDEEKDVLLFDSGRSSIYCCLKSLEIGAGDEVIVPGYTCSVVVNAIRWAGAKPVFVDIKKNFNINHKKIEEKVSDKTKCVLVHHTFGIAADMKSIKQITQENNLTLIEDCAHSIGGEIENKKAGEYGDISIFSFGTNKVISGIRGGAAVTDKKNIAEKLELIESKLSNQPIANILRYLLYYPTFFVGRKLYHIKLGKWILGLLRLFRIIPEIISEKEKRGDKPAFIPSKMPNFLAKLGLNQIKRLNEFNYHRNKISNIYKEKLPDNIIPDPIKEEGRLVSYRFPILIEEPEQVKQQMLKKGYQLSTGWTGANIVPKNADFDFCYNKGACPRAESISKKILLLPTNINTSPKKAEELSDQLVKLV
ncbi:MAG: DegT/DnrJ/EryC1/StrS family aminotransferase [Candidatus Paceibacteria bacterium]